jgi:hypothetical protein
MCPHRKRFKGSDGYRMVKYIIALRFTIPEFSIRKRLFLSKDYYIPKSDRGVYKGKVENGWCECKYIELL